MPDHNHVKPFRTWVAIDVAKDFHAVIVESGSKKKVFKMANSRTDHDRLISYVRSLEGPAVFGLEATGNYHRTLANRILSEGFEMRLLSSLAANRYREALHNSWDKNDPKDAAVLLEMLKRGLTQTFIDPLLAGHHDLQELSKTYSNLTLAKMRLHHSILTHYLPMYFPEVQRYWISSSSGWLFRLLSEFPTAAHIASLDLETFVCGGFPLLGPKQAKRQILTQIHQLAQTSTGLPFDINGAGVATFKLQLRRFLQLNDERKALTDLAHEILSSHPDYEILLSVPGIGPINALVILAEAGDVRRFKHYKQFLNYCGLALSKCQSGQFRSKEQLSKRGNARLRLAFWMAAQTAIRGKENSFREKFRRYIHADPLNKDLRRKGHTAVAAKVARVVYGLIKNSSKYESHFEQALPSGSIPLCRAVEANPTS